MKSLVPETIALQKIIRKLPLSDKSRIIYKVIRKSIQCVQSLWQEKKFVNRVEWDGNLLKTSWGRGGKTLVKRWHRQDYHFSWVETHEAFIILSRLTAIALRLTRAKMPLISQETTLRSQSLSIYFALQISIQIPLEKITGFHYSVQREWIVSSLKIGNFVQLILACCFSL